ncbi:MAG: hypothetical protein J5654_06400, partial [Victivallales bacterium]|nr:hypothetical protein [Victivallales bacterium]
HPDCATTEAAWSFTPQDTECYEAASGTAAITVLPATLTVTANDATRAYGTPNPQFSYEITGFVLREDAGVLEQQPAVTCEATETSVPGDYAITESGALAANYTFQYIDGTLTITARIITIQANDCSKRLGSTDPELTYQIIGEEPVTDNAISGSLTRESGETIGIYRILQGTLTISDNYAIVFYPGVFTIQPSELEIATDDSGNPQLFFDEITYGEELDGIGQIHGTIISTATGEEVPGTFHWERDGEILPAGEHELTWIFTPDDEEKYSPIQGDTILTVHPALLTVQAQDAEREYAQKNPPFAVEITGFVLDEDISVLQTLPVATTTADRQSYPGEYPITVAGGVAKNYRFDYHEGTLTIFKAKLSLVNGSGNYAFLSYGQSLSEAGIYDPYLYDEANREVHGTLTWLEPDYCPDCATTSAEAIFTPDDQSRYAPVVTTVNIGVFPTLLGLACNGFTREYNQENPKLTYIFFDFVLGDTEETAVTSKPVMHTDAELTSPPGYYGVWASDYAAPNYIISRSDAIVEITKAHLTVGPLGVNATDLVYGQSLNESDISGQIIQFNKSPITEVPGTFAWETPGIILPSGTSRQKWIYTPEYEAGYEHLEGYVEVRVHPAPLTVSLANATRLYGETNPDFTYALTGFVGEEDAQALLAQPLVECSATPTSDVGEYAIRCAENEDGNYQLVCQEGLLTVQPRHLDIAANSLTKSYLDEDPELTYSTSGDGLVNGDVLTGKLERDPGETAGQYTIRQGTLMAPENYDTQFTNGTLTIASLKPVLIEAHGSEFIYGQTIGESDYGATFANPVTGEIISGTLTIEAPEFRPWAGSAKHRVYFQPDEADKYTTAEAVVRFTILPRPLHVSLTPPIVNYGQNLTEFDYAIQASDVLPNDEITLYFPLLENGTSSLGVGSYPVIATVLAADRNVAHSYEVVMDETCLTVLPATIEVYADHLTTSPGAPMPELTFTLQGNDFEDTTTLAETLTGSMACEVDMQCRGVYPVTQGTLATDGNHTLLFHDGSLTVRDQYMDVLVDAQKYATVRDKAVFSTQLGDCDVGISTVDLKPDETLFEDFQTALPALQSGGTLWLAPGEPPLRDAKIRLGQSLSIRCNQLGDVTASSRLCGELEATPGLGQLILANLEIVNNLNGGSALNLHATPEVFDLEVKGCTFAADHAVILGDFTHARLFATDLLYRDCGLRLLPNTFCHDAVLQLDDLSFTHEESPETTFWHIYCENAVVTGDENAPIQLRSCVFDGISPNSDVTWEAIRCHLYDASDEECSANHSFQP